MEIIYRYLIPWHKHKWAIRRKYFGGDQGKEVHLLECQRCLEQKLVLGGDLV